MTKPRLQKLRRRRRKGVGFTMIEVMVALLLTAIATSGIIALFMVQSRSAGYSRHATEATILAQDELERLRATNALSGTGTATGINEHGKTGGIFTRAYAITANADYLDITVTVSWDEDGGANRVVTLRTRKSL